MTRMLLTAALTCLTAAPLWSGEHGRARSDYILHCSGCHTLTGEGTVNGGIPAFPDSIQHIAGLENGRTYMVHVPGVISNDMSDAEIAAVLNYILDQWGEGERHFSADEVTARRAQEIGDVVVYRRRVVEELRADGVELAEYPWP